MLKEIYGCSTKRFITSFLSIYFIIYIILQECKSCISGVFKTLPHVLQTLQVSEILSNYSNVQII